MGRVLVAGSINMDVVAKAGRHPRIGETVAGNEVLFLPGGKGANQAIAASKLGAPTSLIACIGQDAFGRDLRAVLTATTSISSSCATRRMRRPARPSSPLRMEITPSSSFPARMLC